MPVDENTKEKAGVARKWLNKILPRPKKKKTAFNQGLLGKAAGQIRGRREEQKRQMEELGM